MVYKRLLLLFLIIATGFLYGCASPAFYFQAINGQNEIWQRMEPIPTVISRDSTSPTLRKKLEKIQEIRKFASTELSLPDNNSYRAYADLKRSYVIWNVFAAEELSVNPKTWCFFIVGCVSYRGYFSKEAAYAYAADLKAQGYDVYIGGVPAYSTLGHFDDPVLSTFVHYSELELSGLIFHELSHQLLFIKNDSTFNESFASTVEKEGVKRWIAKYGSEQDQTIFNAKEMRRNDYVNLVMKYKDKLADLYVSNKSDEEKRTEKQSIFSEMKTEYDILKRQWQGYNGYDGIFSQPLNNAFIASTALYTQLVPKFQLLLKKNNYELEKFYKEVKILSKEPKEIRDSILQNLSEHTAP